MKARNIISLFGARAQVHMPKAPRRKASDYAAVLVGLGMLALMQGNAPNGDFAVLSTTAQPVIASEQEAKTPPAIAEVALAEPQVEPAPSQQQPQPIDVPSTPSAEVTATPAPVAPPSGAPTPAATSTPVPQQARAETSSRSSRPSTASAGTVTERFIQENAEAARVSMGETGVPASVTLAQAVLESNSGQSLLSTKGKNYFGIKARGKEGPAGVIYMDTWEVLGGESVTKREPFRAYHDSAESFADHGLYLRENARYAEAFKHTDDARQFARLIHKAGYATDPDYSTKLIRLMDRYELYQYDR